MTGHFSLCVEGLSIGHDGGDAVSADYGHPSSSPTAPSSKSCSTSPTTPTSTSNATSPPPWPATKYNPTRWCGPPISSMHHATVR
jgi:hypothetical protein